MRGVKIIFIHKSLADKQCAFRRQIFRVGTLRSSLADIVSLVIGHVCFMQYFSFIKKL